MKMKSENESENEYFWKNGGGVHFSKIDHFQFILMFIFSSFSKNGRKMKTKKEAKMAKKWLLWTTLIEEKYTCSPNDD